MPHRSSLLIDMSWLIVSINQSFLRSMNIPIAYCSFSIAWLLLLIPLMPVMLNCLVWIRTDCQWVIYVWLWICLIDYWILFLEILKIVVVMTRVCNLWCLSPDLYSHTTLGIFILHGNLPFWNDKLQMKVSSSEIPSMTYFTDFISMLLPSCFPFWYHYLWNTEGSIVLSHFW